MGQSKEESRLKTHNYRYATNQRWPFSAVATATPASRNGERNLVFSFAYHLMFQSQTNPLMHC